MKKCHSFRIKKCQTKCIQTKSKLSHVFCQWSLSSLVFFLKPVRSYNQHFSGQQNFSFSILCQRCIKKNMFRGNNFHKFNSNIYIQFRRKTSVPTSILQICLPRNDFILFYNKKVGLTRSYSRKNQLCIKEICWEKLNPES